MNRLINENAKKPYYYRTIEEINEVDYQFKLDRQPPAHLVIIRALIDLEVQSFDDLADIIYGVREDGGPLGPKNVIHVAMSYVKGFLRPEWKILPHPRVTKVGRNEGGYRLMRSSRKVSFTNRKGLVVMR